MKTNDVIAYPCVGALEPVPRDELAEGVRRFADRDGFALPIVARVVAARAGCELS